MGIESEDLSPISFSSSLLSSVAFAVAAFGVEEEEQLNLRLSPQFIPWEHDAELVALQLEDESNDFQLCSKQQPPSRTVHPDHDQSHYATLQQGYNELMTENITQATQLLTLYSEHQQAAAKQAELKRTVNGSQYLINEYKVK